MLSETSDDRKRVDGSFDARSLIYYVHAERDGLWPPDMNAPKYGDAHPLSTAFRPTPFQRVIQAGNRVG